MGWRRQELAVVQEAAGDWFGSGGVIRRPRGAALPLALHPVAVGRSRCARDSGTAAVLRGP